MVVAKTTEIYTHVYQRYLANISSPLDCFLGPNKLTDNVSTK
jgi:hypothetical protein